MRGTDRLEIRGGRFYSEWFRPKTRGWLIINANRIDGKVELEADELSMGVREGNLNVVKQKLDGDPLIYNTGGDVTTPIAPSGGHDILVIASGNVTLSSGIDATGSATNTEGKIAIGTGGHFVRNSNGEVILPCGISNGMGNDCNNMAQSLSLPGGPLETVPGDFPLSGKITIAGEVKAKVIIMTSREIEINGNLHAVKDGDPAQAAVSLFATKSITVTGTIKTDKNPDNPNYGSVSLVAPTINVASKITTDQAAFQASANHEATTGSITTGAIEAGSYIVFNAGSIIYGGGGAIAALLPAVSFDPGDFTIKTAKLTAGRYILAGATGTIETGAIELLENTEEVPVGAQDVRIHANVGKPNAPVMNVGGGTNGPASITVHGTTDLSLDKNRGVIYLSNGPSGDITLDGSKIHTFANSHGVQSLIANAGTGKVTLKGAPIAVDGNASVAAGSILLIGDEVKSNGTTLSASDTMSTAEETPPQIIIATSKLTLTGDLTAQVAGNMLTGVHLVPKGSYVDDPLSHFEGESIRINPNNITPTEDQVLIAGSGNLNVKAKSEKAKVSLSGKPFKFSTNGTSEIKAEGIQSEINVDYAGSATGANSLIFNGGAVTLTASNPNGDAGDVTVRADRVHNVATANVSLKANAEGSNGIGGNVSLTLDRGNLNLGSGAGAMSIVATSKGGDGGNITIENAIHNGSVTLVAQTVEPVLNASALVVDGKGGEIRVHADQIINNSSGENPKFFAHGAETGRGGEIVIRAKEANLFDINLNADGGFTRGNGGKINVKATDSISLSGDQTSFSIFSARGSGDGRGGEIKISEVEVNLEHSLLLASAGPDGDQGGKVSVTNSTEFDVNENINVDPGDNSPGTFDGSITLNGVECRQWNTGFAWPKFYWNCTGNNPPSTLDEVTSIIASNIPASLQTVIQSANPRIYVHRDANQHNTFFHRFNPNDDPPPLNAAGYTIKRSVDNNTYVSAFEHCTDCGSPGEQLLTPEKFAEASAHEFGHALDIGQAQSITTSAIYDLYVKNDLLLLDYDDIGTQHRRDPCVATATDPAPFDGVVINDAGTPICVGGVIDSQYAGFSNSKIMLELSAQVEMTGNAWSEPFSQAFSFRLYNNTGMYLLPVTDGVFARNYFFCVNAEAVFLLTGTNSIPAACSNAIPSWYQPYQ
ncbi:MAG: hypothetical protein K2Y39_26305 [Candidatus Obscuribacterales bacterium]|nr:hypothetical protein [Candidatus Obscuribacterales bacterium]